MMNDNKLIAEFMGYDISTSLRDGVECVEYADNNIRALSDTHYHTSWDWLMPVVEKIYSLDAHIDFFRVINFEATYKRVVEFIKEYNNED
jgi:hypothetical protein